MQQAGAIGKRPLVLGDKSSLTSGRFKGISEDLASIHEVVQKRETRINSPRSGAVICALWRISRKVLPLFVSHVSCAIIVLVSNRRLSSVPLWRSAKYGPQYTEVRSSGCLLEILKCEWSPTSGTKCRSRTASSWHSNYSYENNWCLCIRTELWSWDLRQKIILTTSRLLSTWFFDESCQISLRW